MFGSLGRTKCGGSVVKKGLSVVLVNYLLVAILGAIVATALYAAKWDMSPSGQAAPVPSATAII